MHNYNLYCETLMNSLTHTIDEEMLSRLDFISLKPKVIVSLGEIPSKLKSLYPEAVFHTSFPTSDQSVDLLYLHLPEALDTILSECKRVLRPEGFLLLSVMNVEMHQLGDQLLAMGFKDVVTDREDYPPEVIYAAAFGGPIMHEARANAEGPPNAAA